MKNRIGCGRLGAVLFLLFSVLVFVTAGIFMLLESSYSRLSQMRAQYMPPTVVIRGPESDASVPTGSYMTVSITATGVRPIASAELWMDGALQETQKSEGIEGISPFYADFSILMPSEGPHLLFVRAIDTAGLICQSQLISLTGMIKPSEAYQAVPLQEGQTLDEIAAANDTQAGILQQLNPGLGVQPPPGSILKVPAPAEEKGPEPGPTAPAPVPAGGEPIVMPDVPMMEIMSDRSTGVQPSGPFIPEPALFSGSGAPPAAPTGLQAEVKDCKVILRWNDNADDEEYYYVYVVPVTFHGFAVPFANLKPSLKTGPTWFEFQPSASGSLNIWVEAANSYGSQPGNDLWVYVPYVSGCAPTLAQKLDIKVLDMTVEGNLDKVYCYISFENAPEQRVPMNSSAFIYLQGGKNQDMPYDTSYTISVPKDGTIDLNGECDGWSGDVFKYIGTFSTVLGSETWNGDRQVLQGKGFQIGISIKPVPGNTGIASLDPTLPAPYNVIEAAAPNDHWFQNMYPPAKMLRWKWDGDLTKIDSFQIFLNGQPYNNWSPLKDFEKVVQLPGECGQLVRWQVAVRAGNAISSLSAPFAYDLPACQVYLRVRFDGITFWRTDDGWPGDMCDTLDTYFKISVRDVTRSFWNTNFFIPVNCKGKTFKDMTGGPYPGIYGPEPYVVTLPVSLGEDFNAIQIKAWFWDSDPPGNPDDLYATFSEHPLGAYIPKIGDKWTMSETWKDTGEYTGYSSYDCSTRITSGQSITDEATSFLNFSYSIYPNNCRDKPPAEGF